MEGYDMPTDIQFKDELRKEEIKLEEQIEMLKNKEYDKMLAKFEEFVRVCRIKVYRKLVKVKN